MIMMLSQIRGKLKHESQLYNVEFGHGLTWQPFLLKFLENCQFFNAVAVQSTVLVSVQIPHVRQDRVAANLLGL